MKFIMLECFNCGISFPYNPLESNNINKKELPFRTPISGCHGFVSFIDSEKNDTFYGCGKTGAIWRQKQNFYRDIEQIIKKYPHRELCYIKTTEGWEPKPVEPENMDELIDKEVIEELDKFERD